MELYHPSLPFRTNMIREFVMVKHSDNDFFSEQQVFDVLSHEIRRKIMRLLAQHSFLAYSDLKKELKLSTGVLYHHLQKLQQLNLVTQRETKEYELTSEGYHLLEYVRSLENDEVITRGSFMASSPTASVLLKSVPIARMVAWNPLGVALGSLLIIFLGVVIQANFDIMFMGPYLVPTEETFEIKLLLEILTFIIAYAVLEGVYHFFYSNRDLKKELVYLSGILVLPAISSGGVILLWLFSQIIPVLPEIIFWLVIFILHALYFLVMFNLLVNIKRTAVDKSLFFVLGLFYLFLLFVHLLM